MGAWHSVMPRGETSKTAGPGALFKGLGFAVWGSRFGV